MKGFVAFAIIALFVIAGIALLSTIAFDAPDERRAVWTSAVVAYVVQLLAFAIVKVAGRDNWMAGWGLGMLLRFGSLVAYGVLGMKVLALPTTAALVTLAIAFFVTTLIEPVLLKL
jgi:hypothetical protein